MNMKTLTVAEAKTLFGTLSSEEFARQITLIALKKKEEDGYYLIISKEGVSDFFLVQSLTKELRIFKTLDAVQKFVRNHFPETQAFTVSFSG